MELYYKRVESVRKGRVHPARTQTVVIFLPDVRSCLPTRFEWDELTVKYKQHLEKKLQSNNRTSEDRELETVDQTERKSHATIRDECVTPINDGGNDEDADCDDIDMDDGSINKLTNSMAADGKHQQHTATSTNVTKSPADESSGSTTVASAAISKALHKNIISK